MVVTIVVATVAIGYSREYGAATAARALRERVRVQATVLRDGLPVPTAVEAVVPGDVVLLAAGSLAPPEAEFDRGIRRFGYLLTGAMLIVTLLVFVAHVVRGRPPIDTLLFASALAAGLSPELLPAILSVNLARGAQMMARQGVLVRRLNAIENLGSAHVLCTDKTCTLTEGVVRVEGAPLETATVGGRPGARRDQRRPGDGRRKPAGRRDSECPHSGPGIATDGRRDPVRVPPQAGDRGRRGRRGRRAPGDPTERRRVRRCAAHGSPCRQTRTL